MITPGTRIGPYEIVSALGAGGMGEVYRAHDAKLNRDVAIKVLLPAVANDPDRLARFSREAQVLASLNHPNIAHIHGLEDANGVRALVMELVEGPTLADRIAQGPIPLDEALPIAKQIAEALEAAHEQGIIHRDLKPANIKIRPDGTVKVLDFGLAKAMDPTASSTANATMSPTLSMHATQAGIILGTAAYMSPEQARGAAVDRRADVWAFGAVLFEMLTGRRAFEGETVSDTMAAVLKIEPVWTALPSYTPAPIATLLRRCLEKDRKQRLQAIGEARILLGAPMGERAVAAAAPARLSGLPRLAWGGAALGGLLLLAAGALIGVVMSPDPPRPARVQFDLRPGRNYANQIAVSPGGTHLVTPANGLWLHAFEKSTSTMMPGTNGGWPFWSPDGRSVAFFSTGKLQKVDLLGTPPQTLAIAAAGTGGAWNQDGVIVFAPDAKGPLFRVSAAGGVATPLTQLDAARAEIGHWHPWFLPDGQHFLYLAVSSKAEDSGIFVASLDAPKGILLVKSRLRAAFAPPDSLLFMRDSTLMAQRFDLDRLELTGEPFPVAENVGVNTDNGAAGFGVSDTGMLAYRNTTEALIGRVTTLKWFDRQGTASAPLDSPADYAYPVLSPDGQRVVVAKVTRSNAAPVADLWMLDLIRGTSTRFTFDPALDDSPRWSPDGSQIAFTSNRLAGISDLYVKSASGVVPEELLLKSARNKQVEDWSSDGRFLLYREEDPQTRADLWVLPLTGDRKPVAIVRSPFADMRGRFSPDGRWIAYQANESGRDEVYLVPFPKATTRIQISTAGGRLPRWRRDGREFFYLAPTGTTGSVMAVDIDLSATGAPRVGLPRKLFEVVTILGHWDTSADGQRFLMIVAGDETPVPVPITVIANWDQR